VRGVNAIGAAEQTGLGDVLVVLEALSRGDLTRRMPPGHQGIFGRISGAIDTLVGNLSGILRKLAGSSEMLNRTALEIAGATDEASHRGQTSAASLEETAAALQTLANTVEGTASSARSAEDFVGGARARAEATRVVADKAVEAIRRIQDSSGAIGRITDMIEDVAFQTNLLALNAGVEAARAGEHGRGFAVVAEAINQLSHQTATAADRISKAIAGLREMIVTLKTEAGKASGDAGAVLSAATETDQMLGRMTGSVEQTRAAALDIEGRAREVRAANDSFAPYFHELVGTTHKTAEGVKEARSRVDGLVTMGESVVQNSVLAGASHADAALIDFVRRTADQIGQLFETAVENGKIGAGALFDQHYAPIPNTDPQQVMAPFTALTDAVLPAVQEPALDLDPRIVFCAAVDRNGYLPTHNRKYSQPQGDDPVWNMANCRNRRIFGDRVGLRAGRSQDPFLIQIYRRDMGGGDFVLMKDLSAPIRVRGRHWGGLRLAYRF